MKRLLAVLLLVLQSASAFAQQSKASAPLVQSIRVEKSKPEKKSGKWVDGKRARSSIQTYDHAGNLVESIVHKAGGDLYVKYAATYDAAGMKTEETYADAKGSLLSKVVYQYDGNKRLIGKLHFGPNGAPAGESTVRYKDGRIIGLISYDSKGSVTSRTVYTYHDAEKKVEFERYLPAGFSGGEVMSFDNQGRLVESISYKLNVSSGEKFLRQYDDAGNLIEEVLQVGGGATKWRYSYEFDAHGNWVKKTVSLISDKPGDTSEKPIESTYRIISYSAEAGKPKRSQAWSLAEVISSNATESVWRGSTVNRSSFIPPVGGLSGQVNTFVIVNELGKVTTAIPYGHLTADRGGSGDATRLKEVIEDSVKNWKFEPTVQSGIPLRVTGSITFSFR